ncbi:hypothetical protein HanHA300_Chr16g0626481 [Helianthus annuus]|nr:hypothetical protein HanHA300_Chr16g0626481 [Helianthus annuus]
MGGFYILLSPICIVSMANKRELTDSLEGLAFLLFDQIILCWFYTTVRLEIVLMMFLDLLCCVSNESWDYQGCLCWNCTGVDVSNILKGLPKFTVVGHRGHEMNILQSTDNKMKTFKRIQFFRSIKLLIIHLISLNLTFRYLFLDMCCVFVLCSPRMTF